MNKRDPIGFFDSGVGGVSVLRTAVRMLPNENFIYFGDNKNAPYGTKSEREVTDLSRNALRFLLDKGAKAVVIACNTATCSAAGTLRREWPDLIIIGTEPAIKLAHDRSAQGTILVLATPVSLHSSRYLSLHASYGEHAVSLPCPGLMELVESGETEGARVEAYLSEKLAPYLNNGIAPAAVVLGCTHYVFLRGALRRLLPPDTLILDGNEGVVNQLRRRLDAAGLLNDSMEKGETKLFTSGGTQTEALMRRLLSLPE